MVIYEALTPQCWRSVVQVLFVRVDTRGVTNEVIISDIEMVNSLISTGLCYACIK